MNAVFAIVVSSVCQTLKAIGSENFKTIKAVLSIRKMMSPFDLLCEGTPDGQQLIIMTNLTSCKRIADNWRALPVERRTKYLTHEHLLAKWVQAELMIILATQQSNEALAIQNAINRQGLELQSQSCGDCGIEIPGYVHSHPSKPGVKLCEDCADQCRVADAECGRA